MYSGTHIVAHLNDPGRDKRAWRYNIILTKPYDMSDEYIGHILGLDKYQKNS